MKFADNSDQGETKKGKWNNKHKRRIDKYENCSIPPMLHNGLTTKCYKFCWLRPIKF